MPESTHSNVDIPRIEKAVREILLAVGEDPDREGLIEDTQPRRPRVRRADGGLIRRSEAPPQDGFHEHYDEVVLLRDIEFHSLCEHHLLPFTGRGARRVPAGRQGRRPVASSPGSSKASRAGRRCRSG